MIIDEEAYLAHYGILRKSGRYPWGSGEDQSTRNRDFLSYVKDLENQGLGQTEIARGLGYLDDNGKEVKVSVGQLRAAKSIAKTEQKQSQIDYAQRLKDKDMSTSAIGRQMGLNESSVRALLAAGAADKAAVLDTVSSMLRDGVAEKTYIDVGTGVEAHIGVSATKLGNAVAVLREEGYELHELQLQQPGTGRFTTYKILCPPGTTKKDVFLNRDKIEQLRTHTEDGGRTRLGLEYPTSISSDRVGITYADKGGADADGVIYVRPGVPDAHLGDSRYAQVRIAVDGTHYIKGMAMYKDDLPKGVDLQFNTNKKDTGNKLDALKKLSDDPDNPFGAMIDRQQGVMNIVNEEGDWGRWSKSISPQVLSKQPPSLAKSQLDMTFEQRRRDYDEIVALTNPTVKRKLLQGFSDNADSAAVHMKAASLPGQAYHVILPIKSMPPNQIYAPGYKNGESVVLIRYPHGGKFEIPELTVNNRHPEANKLLKGARDAVGIHHSVAERLSGADFDGDTVLVIPNDGKRIKTAAALEGLKNFDPKRSYPPYDGMRTMDGGTYHAATKTVLYGPKGPSSRTKQQEMGNVSNLITDMTIKGASNSELARAVRHSMVVIDAEKHQLDYKESAKANGISQLKEKYQSDTGSKGASTLISRAGSEKRIPEQTLRKARDGGPIDRATGELVYVPTNRGYVDSSGKFITNTTRTTKLADAKDAHSLSSGTEIERIYADHSNKLKNLANLGRREMVNTPNLKYSPSAKKAYAAEVEKLNADLALAIRNRPLERQALVIANATIQMKRDANPGMDATTLKKIKAQALNEARKRTGAQKQDIVITEEGWNAIQAGAISEHKLSQILDNADLDRVRALATPRSNVLMTPTMQTRATTMLNSGATRSEVAAALGVSVSTLDRSTTGSE